MNHFDRDRLGKILTSISQFETGLTKRGRQQLTEAIQIVEGSTLKQGGVIEGPKPFYDVNGVDDVVMPMLPEIKAQIDAAIERLVAERKAEIWATAERLPDRPKSPKTWRDAWRTRWLR